MLVDVNVTTRESLDSMCDIIYCQGFADWSETPEGNIMCDIYILPMNEYESEGMYYQVLGHELRHCMEGNFH